MSVEDFLSESTSRLRDSYAGYPFRNGNVSPKVLSIDSITPEKNNFYNVSATVEIYKNSRTEKSNNERKVVKLNNLHIQILDKFYFKTRMYAGGKYFGDDKFLDRGKTTITMKPGEKESIKIHTLRSRPRINLEKNIQTGLTTYYICSIDVIGATDKGTQARPGYYDPDGPMDYGYDDIFYIKISENEKAKQITLKPRLNNYLVENYLDKNGIESLFDVNTITVNIDHTK